MSKDVEFARNLARSMEEGYGRHNSSLDFRRRGGGIVALMREIIAARPTFTGRYVSMGQVRERWEDCALGEMVSEERFRPGPAGNMVGFEYRIPRGDAPQIQDCQGQVLDAHIRWVFDRVRMIDRLTGRTGHFWKRVE